MPSTLNKTWHDLSTVTHYCAVSAIVTLAAAIITWTAAAALDLVPWLSIAALDADGGIKEIGRSAQIAAAFASSALLGLVPGALRIANLERSHRNFHISMEDVARAYHAAHQADRSGYFLASSEFDRVRERIAYLREHPDLGSLEPQLLEVAAQMSFESAGLAETYSVERVERARSFLKQRMEEAHTMNARIERARSICADIRAWHVAVTSEEGRASSNCDSLRRELSDILPLITIEDAPRANQSTPDNPGKAAA